MKTAAGIEFKDGELEELVQGGFYVIKGRTIYQAKHHKNTGAFLQKIYTHIGDLPLTKRGRYYVWKADSVNSLLGFKLIV